MIPPPAYVTPRPRNALDRELAQAAAKRVRNSGRVPLQETDEPVDPDVKYGEGEELSTPGTAYKLEVHKRPRLQTASTGFKLHSQRPVFTESEQVGEGTSGGEGEVNCYERVNMVRSEVLHQFEKQKLLS
mmetsp:Transcript_11425/g.13541  ORF Transcript_11425/g.13541 Transcript_11425/m.13541 type:complete len:130 (-) Transcript_11425:465-854(-)